MYLHHPIWGTSRHPAELAAPPRWPWICRYPLHSSSCCRVSQLFRRWSVAFFLLPIAVRCSLSPSVRSGVVFLLYFLCCALSYSSGYGSSSSYSCSCCGCSIRCGCCFAYKWRHLTVHHGRSLYLSSSLSLSVSQIEPRCISEARFTWCCACFCCILRTSPRAAWLKFRPRPAKQQTKQNKPLRIEWFINGNKGVPPCPTCSARNVIQ